MPLPAAVADAGGGAGRHLPLARRWRVSAEGVGPLAAAAGGSVLGRGRGPAAAEPAGRDARPPRPQPRRHHSLDEVRRLQAAAGDAVASAGNAFRCRPGSAAGARRLFGAEQSLLLVRLAADSGTRRGELAALRLSDLDGRVLTIERSLSAGVLGPAKSGRTRRVTLGSGTADMIRSHFRAWAVRAVPEQDWLFSPSPRRSDHLTAGALSRRLTRLGQTAGVEHAALHHLRHGVATYLVDHGRLLKAQARLGHRDPATTLRHYSHATPLDDTDVADELDHLLNSLDPRHSGTEQSLFHGLPGIASQPERPLRNVMFQPVRKPPVSRA
jgi:integrase